MQHECNTRNARYATRFPRGKIRSTRGLPGDLCTRFRPLRGKKRVSEPKNGSDTRFFRLFSSNLIGNFLAHHMYFPGRSLFRLFYYFNSLFSLRKTEYEKPRDIIRPGSVLISHSTIGIGHIITVDHQVSPFSASAPLNRYRRGHYSAVRTKSQWLRISQCLK